ncbi:MAG: Predicted ATP-dependent endonuclease, OLD family [uncultured Sulfurovum sp.]|uniref:Predicted ATP-dependent endonuclease, OLD family n=1 Tax=uncultured Sulfurovum sp. TaxID=269237 RepID=A0A6S6UCG1_9BACT|nr:MAG: Predicted ATP-dependent endonuclease, OLD family [uncultured Sulfurovum sp.]
MIELDSCRIYNFKSLDDFELNFSKFTCLIGLNSAGKSTILQAIDFISQQMKGDITGWLKSRDWEELALESKIINEDNIFIGLGFFYKEKSYVWRLYFDINLKRIIDEEIIIIKSNSKLESKTIFKVENSKFMIDKDGGINEGEIIQEYEGSFLAKLKPELLPDVIVEFREYLQNIYSLDLLSPRELKKESKDGSILGLSGENLSAFLNSFDETQKENILKNLQKCYPKIVAYSVIETANGYYRLEVTEKFKDKEIINESKYLNDGVLRVIAILAQLETKQSFLLFDEIENGINSELIEILMDILIASKHQIIVTTHSPMILNYIEDDIAKKSVQYIYKTKEGLTQSIPFFDIPSMVEKLEMMGAGSAYIDTNLEDLIEEIEEVQKSKKEAE